MVPRNPIRTAPPTAGQTDVNAGYYTQDEVKAFVIYAADRGVRVVPEFEMPAHASGYWNVVAEGVQFCPTCAYGACTPSQLLGSDSTFNVLHQVLGEMSQLFPDQVFHIGTCPMLCCTMHAGPTVPRAHVLPWLR